jgi:hypothetical protein
MRFIPVPFNETGFHPQTFLAAVEASVAGPLSDDIVLEEYSQVQQVRR